MAVKATDTITLAVTVDVQKVETYYYQTASTGSKPAKPTTASPSGWQTTEFAFDSSKAIWSCQKTTLTDGTFFWGEVSKASAYQGSIEAWNKAYNAQQTADAAAPKSDAVTSTESVYYRSTTASTPTISKTTTIGTNSNADNAWEYVMLRPKKGRTFYTCEKLTFVDGSIDFTTVRLLDNATYTSKWCSSSDEAFIDGGAIYAHSVTAGQIQGNTITANELSVGLNQEIDDAAKTATNYIGIDSTGIKIANANPDTATTYQHQTATSTEFMVDGESRMLISGDGQRIGKEYVEGATDNESHMELDYHSMKMVDREDVTYFHVSDLRGRTGVAEIEESFSGDGETTHFTLSLEATSSDYTVTFEQSFGPVTKTTTGFTFATPPSIDYTITAVYTTTSARAKAYSMGFRNNSVGYPIGGYSMVTGYFNAACGFSSFATGNATVASGQSSFAEGKTTLSSGVAAHAEGAQTIASGLYSHAQNYETRAASKHQTAIGRYNVEDTSNQYALIVGNGTADNNRSNAHTLDWQGNAVYAGDVTDGSGNILSDKADSADLPTKTSDLTNDSGYITSSQAASTYLPLAGGTLTGGLTAGGEITDGTGNVLSEKADSADLGALAAKSTLTIEHTTIESTSAKNSSAVASGGNVNFTCTCTVPDGYTFAGIQRVGRGGGAGLVLLGFLASDSGDSATLSFRNLGTSPIAANTASATCEFRFIKVTAS